MEISEFIGFLLMAIILLVPFASIYLTLHILSWGERKSLFLDSWFVFLTWIFSGFVVYIFCISAEYGFHKLFTVNPFFTFYPLTIAANIFSIAAVLKIRRNKKVISVVNEIKAEDFSEKNIRSVWQTSIAVSILTMAVTISLVMFVGDISKRNRNQTSPTSNGGNISFE